MYAKIVAELRYSDTFYQRMVLATACALYGFGAWNRLGIVFLIVAALAWWRIFDRKPRVWIALLVNLSVAALWITIATANLFFHGDSLANNVGEIMICVTSLFVLTRTDLTAIDKGSA